MNATVLGISLGTRSTGIAILQKNELLDWRVQSFKGPWSKNKCKLIIEAIAEHITRYEPEIIALKIPTEMRPSKNMGMLLHSLEKFTENKELLLHRYTLLSLKDWFECTSKKALITAITSRFPEFFHTYDKVKQHCNDYHSKTFEAVAAALFCTSVSHK